MNVTADAGPGIYEMSDQEYHADPVPGGSLSSSGARLLLPPSCPARFHYQREHGQPPAEHFDIGHAAHRLVLGVGPELVEVQASDWRTKAAREQAAAARARNAVPLLSDELERVKQMADALALHPIARALFDPDRGRPEQTLIWRDGPSRVMRRARFDWLPDAGPGRMIIPDYKTCRSADPDALARSVHQFGYHQQADWYRAGAIALGLAGDDTAFVFVCQEKDPPYLVTVVELDAMALRIGAIRNRRALEVYARCTSTGQWPGYVEGIELLSLPPWVEMQEGDQ